MFPNHLLEVLATIYHKEHLERARMARLAQEAQARRPRLRERLLSNSGDYLIVFGQKLKARYGSKLQPRPIRQHPLPEGAPGDC
jgi:hypothetical protein